MTPDLLELGRRAVACKGWRWMPGVLTTGGCRLIGQERHGLPDHGSEWACADPVEEGADVRYVWPEHMVGDDWLPALSDDATKGVLLALVREAWAGDVWIGGRWLRPGRIAWMAMGLHRGAEVRVNGADGFDTEAAALVAALEAAPEER